MITSWHLTANRPDYVTRRYADISRLEGTRQSAYLDTKGIPSIGIGFNLRTPAVREELRRRPVEVSRGVCRRRRQTHSSSTGKAQDLYTGKVGRPLNEKC